MQQLLWLYVTQLCLIVTHASILYVLLTLGILFGAVGRVCDLRVFEGSIFSTFREPELTKFDLSSYI